MDEAKQTSLENEAAEHVRSSKFNDVVDLISLDESFDDHDEGTLTRRIVVVQ